MCRTLCPGRLPLCRSALLIWFSRFPGEKELWPTSLLVLHGTVTWGFPWWVHSFFHSLDQSRMRYTKRFSHWVPWCWVTAMINSDTVGGGRAEAAVPSFVTPECCGSHREICSFHLLADTGIIPAADTSKHDGRTFETFDYWSETDIMSAMIVSGVTL